jgi:hypothetical protein
MINSFVRNKLLTLNYKSKESTLAALFYLKELLYSFDEMAKREGLRLARGSAIKLEMVYLCSKF